MVDANISLLSGNTLELHYWFDDKTHTMDAVVQNRCEHEFLGVLKEIAATFNAEIIIETKKKRTSPPWGQARLIYENKFGF